MNASQKKMVIEPSRCAKALENGPQRGITNWEDREARTEPRRAGYRGIDSRQRRGDRSPSPEKPQRSVPKPPPPTTTNTTHRNRHPRAHDDEATPGASSPPHKRTATTTPGSSSTVEPCQDPTPGPIPMSKTIPTRTKHLSEIQFPHRPPIRVHSRPFAVRSSRHPTAPHGGQKFSAFSAFFAVNLPSLQTLNPKPFGCGSAASCPLLLLCQRKCLDKTGGRGPI